MVNCLHCKHFNPRLPCGRRPDCLCTAMSRQGISIHTFLAEGDKHDFSYSPAGRYFNPRLPCGRRRSAYQRISTTKTFQSTPSVWKATAFVMFFRFFCISFQSTPSVWKATCQINYSVTICINFNPRLPCGRRHYRDKRCKQIVKISIHAFRVEGDCCADNLRSIHIYFNPRLPCGRRHIGKSHLSTSNSISIHAFRVEGDPA